MSRQMRIEYPGAMYHVTSRGNCKSDIFLNDSDRYRFLDELSKTILKFGIVCYAYCLMSNHYHLLIETPDGNLSSSIHRLNSAFAGYMNWKHNRVGHLFQGRFRAILVQKETYFLELCRYIVLNPVRAGMVEVPSSYRWSSYTKTTSQDGESNKFIRTDQILSHFGMDREKARREYIRFVMEGIGTRSPLAGARADLVLGDAEFIRMLKEKVTGQVDYREIPRDQRMLFRRGLREIFGEAESLNKEIRNKMILKACNQLDYSQNEVARFLNMHRRTISRILKSGRGASR